jgi:hypothetical protein
MQEITADDIRSASKQFKQVATLYEMAGCGTQKYPLAYWQGVEDSLHRHGGRLIVISDDYRTYDSLQSHLRATPITYHVYVLSGKKYHENSDRAVKLFIRDLFQRRTSRREKFPLISQVMLVRNGKATSVLAPSLISYP